MRFDIDDGSPRKAPKHPSFLGSFLELDYNAIGILKSASSFICGLEKKDRRLSMRACLIYKVYGKIQIMMAHENRVKFCNKCETSVTHLRRL